MRGPRLLLAVTLGVVVLVVSIIVTSDDGLVPTAARVVRWTARTSLLLFALAYVARPAQQLWRSALTKRLLAERKWIGLGFAVSHLAHLSAIITLASPDFGEFLRNQPPTNIVAATTFVLLFAMAITSIDAVKKRMSAKAWKTLHRTGMHFAWISFAGTYAKRAADEPRYLVLSAIVLALGAIRLAAWLRLRGLKGRSSRSQARPA